MSAVTIFGSGDDAIEVEGAIRAEFSAYEDDGAQVAFSDGTVLNVAYDADGCWRIHRVIAGTASYEKQEADGADTDNYSDHVTLRGDLRWVVFAKEVAHAA